MFLSKNSMRFFTFLLQQLQLHPRHRTDPLNDQHGIGGLGLLGFSNETKRCETLGPNGRKMRKKHPKNFRGLKDSSVGVSLFPTSLQKVILDLWTQKKNIPNLPNLLANFSQASKVVSKEPPPLDLALISLLTSMREVSRLVHFRQI